MQLRGLEENDQPFEKNPGTSFPNGESIEKDKEGEKYGWPLRLITKNISSLIIKREELFANYSKVYLNAEYLSDLKYRLSYMTNENL